MDNFFRVANIKIRSRIMTTKTLKAIGFNSIPIIKPGDNLARIILEAIRECEFNLKDGDILVIASKVVSKAEGRLRSISEIKISERAKEIAKRNGFDPVHVELALQEASEVVNDDGVLITSSHLGFICNFSGVDKSNAPKDKYVLLPKNPDQSAETIRQILMKETNRTLAVIIADTQGRPWRKGAVNVAIGCAGINAFKHNKGKSDLYGRILKRSSVCHIDELASFAEPLMGQAGERIPVVIIRGYEFSEGSEKARNIIRSKEENMFR